MKKKDIKKFDTEGEIHREEHLVRSPRLEGVVRNLGIKAVRKIKKTGETHLKVSQIKKKAR